jgi:hypothetical protein
MFCFLAINLRASLEIFQLLGFETDGGDFFYWSWYVDSTEHWFEL